MKTKLLFLSFALFIGAPIQNYAQTISLVKDIKTTETRNGNPIKQAVYRDTLYFLAQRDNTGNKLFKSDGTAAGTTFIGPSIGIDNISNFFFYKNAFYFLYNDQIHGQELWVSDGTPAGTHIFLDLIPGATSSEVQYITLYNNLMFFKANDGVDFSRLFVSDGTVAGTKKLGVAAGVFNGMNEFITFKNKVYFPGSNGTVTHGLFVSDGTDAGTGLVKEGYFGNFGGNFATLNNKMFFGATDDVHGGELWESDGTGVNTKLLFNIAPDNQPGVQSNGGPHNLFEHNGTIYFAASDRIHGNELWATDGTPAGTRMVSDFNTGDGGISPANFTLYNNEVYFFGSLDRQLKMYKTDGTAAGTKLIKVFPAISFLYTSIIFENLIYMTLGDGLGATMWSSDGTEAGTKLIEPVINTFPTYDVKITEYKNELYFPAYTSATGMELFKFSGVATGLNENTSTQSGIILYPNPGSGSFRFFGKNITDLEAYDSQGNQVEVNFSDEKYQLKTKTAGLYFVRINKGSSEEEVLKVVIR